MSRLYQFQQVFTKKTCFYLPNDKGALNQNCVIWESEYIFRKKISNSCGKFTLNTVTTENRQACNNESDIPQGGRSRRIKADEDIRPVVKEKKAEHFKKYVIDTPRKWNTKLGTDNAYTRNKPQKKKVNVNDSVKIKRPVGKIKKEAVAEKNIAFKGSVKDQNKTNSGNDIELDNKTKNSNARQNEDVDIAENSAVKKSLLNRQTDEAELKSPSKKRRTTSNAIKAGGSADRKNTDVKPAQEQLAKDEQLFGVKDASKAGDSLDIRNTNKTLAQLQLAKDKTPTANTSNSDVVNESVDKHSNKKSTEMLQLDGAAVGKQPKSSEPSSKIAAVKDVVASDVASAKATSRDPGNQNRKSDQLSNSTDSIPVHYSTPNVSVKNNKRSGDVVDRERKQKSSKLASYELQSSFPRSCNGNSLVYDLRQNTQDLGVQCNENCILESDKTSCFSDDKLNIRSNDQSGGAFVLKIRNGRRNFQLEIKSQFLNRSGNS